jgi:hypothetical protein
MIYLELFEVVVVGFKAELLQVGAYFFSSSIYLHEKFY